MNTFQILDDAIYSDGDLVLGLNTTHAALATARRDGKLRFARVGRQIVYRGDWVREWLEAIANRPQMIVTCPEQHKPLVYDLHAAFAAGDFPGVIDVVRRAKAAGVRLKLNLPDGKVWDSELCELPTQADFEAVGRDLAIKASALEGAAAHE